MSAAFRPLPGGLPSDPKIYRRHVPHRWLSLEGIEVLRLSSLAFAEDHERLSGPSRRYFPFEGTCADFAFLAAHQASLASRPSARRSVNWPEMAFTMRANRAFLGRAVRYLAAEAGMRQFLDLGTGIPTAGNTHEVAQAIAPESRVVYVDYDPVVLAHARALLERHEAGVTEYIDADLRDTDAILTRAAQLLDFTKPVAVTMLTVLHAIPDADAPHAIVAKLMASVPSGSYLAISHAGSDLIGQEREDSLKGAWGGRMQQQIIWRSREQVARFFEGTDLIAPGLVRVEEWRPDAGTSDEGKSAGWAAVGRKR